MVKPSLIVRSILYPGSSAHVTNSRDYGGKKRMDGTGEIIMAGDQELLTHEWGDATLLINTPRGTESVKLT